MDVCDEMLQEGRGLIFRQKGVTSFVNGPIDI